MVAAESDTTTFRVGEKIGGPFTQGSPDGVGTTAGLND